MGINIYRIQYNEILKKYNNYGGTNAYTYTLWELSKADIMWAESVISA